MRILTRALPMLWLLLPLTVHASSQWSSCQTIVSVSNYLASNSLMLGLSPGISGCAPNGVSGGMLFTVGSQGVTAANINTFLASSLVAYTTGHQVLIYYDTTTAPICTGQIIANSGYSGNCP